MDPRWPNNFHEQNQQLPIPTTTNKLMDPRWPNKLMDPRWPNTYTPPMQHEHPIQNPNANTLQNKLTSFWNRQRLETEHCGSHSLPLSRIKKIMKSDENVRMISAEAPVLLSKACDMFMQELTLRAWVCTEESKRRTLQKSDISAALSTSDLFDFLVDIVPREKPIVAMPPVMPSIVMPRMQLRDDTVGLPVQMVGNDEQGNEMYEQVQGSSFFLPYQSVWPPLPDL